MHADKTIHNALLKLLLDDEDNLEVLDGLAEEHIVAVANHQKVIFSLAKCVLHSDEKPHISLAGQRYLDDLWNKQRSRTQQCLSQLHELTKLLNGIGVTPLYFKGAAALLQQWYLHPEERFFLDIDVLLKPEDIDVSNQALLESGYYPSQTAVREGHHHLPGLKHDHRPLSVEIHIQPLPARAGFLLMADDVFEHATTMQFKNESFGKYSVPSLSHSLVLSVITNEICEYGLSIGRVNLKHALDVMALRGGIEDLAERHQTLVINFTSMLGLLKSDQNVSKRPDVDRRALRYKHWLLSKTKWRLFLHYIMVHVSVDYLQRRYDDYSHRGYLYFCCKEMLYILSNLLRKVRIKYLSN